MVNVRWHGRGGSGVVTAARLLGASVVMEDLFAISYPSFGPERRGAPVQAFTKISKTPIRDRSQIYEPDHVVILDSSLLKTVPVLQGLNKGGLVIINTQNRNIVQNIPADYQVIIVDATGIALEQLGRPIINTAMLGAYSAATGLIKIESVFAAIEAEFKEIAAKNIKAAEKAYQSVKEMSNNVRIPG